MKIDIDTVIEALLLFTAICAVVLMNMITVWN